MKKKKIISIVFLVAYSPIAIMGYLSRLIGIILVIISAILLFDLSRIKTKIKNI